uniref:(northern house mosquito) hypothetical protein n=1 Tax=Culex pipiens TaxID=7175 RepID=A0A8D8FB57_CULPI
MCWWSRRLHRVCNCHDIQNGQNDGRQRLDEDISFFADRHSTQKLTETYRKFSNSSTYTIASPSAAALVLTRFLVRPNRGKFFGVAWPGSVISGNVSETSWPP